MTGLLVLVAIAAYTGIGIGVGRAAGRLPDFDANNENDAALIGMAALLWPVALLTFLFVAVPVYISRRFR